jgi:hypothetical protein
MRRAIVVCLALGLLATAGTSARDEEEGAAGGQDRHAALRHDLDVMSARLSGARPPSQQVIADAQLLASGYRSLVPFVPGFGQADHALNRRLARRSLEWLSRASVLYGRDPLVAQAFLQSYDSIGGFYRDYGPYYRPGAFVAYAGAARLARRLVLYRLDTDRFEREMERYALAYGTLAAGSGALLTPWNAPRDLPDVAPQEPAPTIALEPLALPAVDVAKLTAEQKAAWIEARDRFRNVAPNVYGARVLLNQLSDRLRRQRLELHPQDAANALKMQGFLEDAVDLMREGSFDAALEALTRADYVRVKLRSVTGQ